jgi:hypothetical protein
MRRHVARCKQISEEAATKLSLELCRIFGKDLSLYDPSPELKKEYC